LIEKQGGKIKIEKNLMEKEIQNCREKYNAALADFRFNQGAEAFLQLISQADAFINQNQVWAITDLAKKEELLGALWLVLAHVADFVYPYIPETSAKIKESLGIHEEKEFLGKEFLVKRLPPLFPKLNS